VIIFSGRTDRDSYVEIIFDNVLPNMEDNFQKYPVSYIDTLGERYDYASVMHYDRYAFSVDGQSATIVPKEDAGSGAERMGQRQGFRYG
jgi:meprin B